MAVILHRVSEAFTPADDTIDLSAALGAADIPQFVGFTYWVSTAGGASAGGIVMNLTWLDANGQTRTLEGGAGLSLQDGAAGFSAPVAVLTRQSSSSQFDLNIDLVGVADGAQVRYALVFSTGDGEGQTPI